jgi:hypothetical protein
MKRNKWAKHLGEFKEKEEAESVLFVAGNAQLTRIVVGWTNTRVSRATRLSKYVGSNDEAMWEWLWKNARYSLDELVVKSGVDRKALESKLATLIANRVLYPDGTVNAFVQRYLRSKVLKLLNVTMRKTG